MLKIFKNRHSALLEKNLAKHHAAQLATTLEHKALEKTEPGVSRQSNTGIVVSLTTIPERIHNIHITIESIFEQSQKVDRIVLWLAKDRFGAHDIPAIVKKQQDRGLDVEFCETDLGPYTKFFYCLKKYPDNLVVTIDDDLMYPIDLIDQLYRQYLKDPTKIYCHRAHRITLNSQNVIQPYKNWDWSIKDSNADLRVFPTGVGGVLYFPGCFDDEILNQEKFLELAPKADDVWLKAMSLKKGVLCQHVPDLRIWKNRFVQIPNSQVVKLKSQNKSKDGGNDKKIEAVFKHYQLENFLV